MSPDRRATVLTAVLFFCTLLVVVLAYVPVVRVHQGWEDEVYWFSTCYSMVRGSGPTPSVLQGFSGTQSPLRFYGPVLFWLGALVLKVFGATVESWRSYTFAGGVAFLGTIALLFRRWFSSWLIASVAALLFSLTVGSSFAFSLPGRPDSWGMALLVLAIAAVVPRDTPVVSREAWRSGPAIRYVCFGLLLGLAATTSPRTWLLIASMFVAMPLLVSRQRILAVGSAVLTALVTASLVLLPLHLSPWGFLVYVHAASSHDTRDISPLMGGSWGFGHAISQTVYYGALLAILGVLQVTRWRHLSALSRWLLAAGLLNVLLTFLLLSRALNMSAYWAFPLEISTLVALIESPPSRRLAAARALGYVLLVYMFVLRTARELPAWLHWRARDPAVTERLVAGAVPAGSVVYGPLGQYFYPVLRSGSDYLYLQDWTTPGRSSVPGVVGTQVPMLEACHRPAFLIWPVEDENAPLPALSHASMHLVAERRANQQSAGRMERAIESVPGGRSEPEDMSVAIYRLQMNAGYCEAELTRSANSAHQP